jgi:ferredoxin
MTHIVTRLCLRDTACVDVCPVECMVLGKPEEEWPWLYIDPDTCIDCGACIPECPYEAIFPEEEVPFDYEAPAGVWIANTKELLSDGQKLEGVEIDGHVVNVLNAKQMAGGEVMDFTEDIPPNYDFFSEGPGYEAMD